MLSARHKPDLLARETAAVNLGQGFPDDPGAENMRRKAAETVLDHGVAAIPVSAFYASGAVRNVVRYCFAKRDATLNAVLERLAGLVRLAA